MYRTANTDVQVVDADGGSIEDKRKIRKREKQGKGLDEKLAKQNYQNPLTQADSDESGDDDDD